MKTYTITEDQLETVKKANAALKNYNELSGKGLGFDTGFSDMFGASFNNMFNAGNKPSIPKGADGPYPTGLKASEELTSLIETIEKS